jgi:CBS domain-containing protein
MVRARDVMSDAVFCCTEDTPVDAVLAEMADEQIRRVPVVNGARHLVGVVSLGDLSQAKSKRAETRCAKFRSRRSDAGGRRSATALHLWGLLVSAVVLVGA